MVVKKKAKRKKQQPEDKLLEKVLKIMEDKKALDIRIFNVQGENSYTDYIVCCTGTSKVHLRTLADALQKELKKEHIAIKSSKEKESGWLVIDCGMVVVHCMGQEERDHYKLEELWQDADVVYHHY